SKKREVSHELADILYHVFLIAEDEGIDLSSALGEKLELTGKRYPVEKARGKNQKYTAYSTK
ncbi:MAG TPA: MazG-like family protein, partial [archaeon]|nr:MazG-like family protein [archaeon]